MNVFSKFHIFVFFSAVKNEDGIYYLNGDPDDVSTDELIFMGGTLFQYSHTDTGVDVLSAIGPLSEPLTVQVCPPVIMNRYLFYC